MPPHASLLIRSFQQASYDRIWALMQSALPGVRDGNRHEIWLGTHNPIYTLGQAGKIEHLLKATDIPVVRSDRGGQITFHGPGQIMVYTLFNLKALGWGVRRLVRTLENTVIEYCEQHTIQAESNCQAPGVYIDKTKVASIGLRVRQGVSYHGMAVNVNTNLQPFQAINPCGYANLTMTNLRDHGIQSSPMDCGMALCKILAKHMGIADENIHPVREFIDKS